MHITNGRPLCQLAQNLFFTLFVYIIIKIFTSTHIEKDMKDLSNENVIHVKKNGVEYLQFRKLLEYSDIIE